MLPGINRNVRYRGLDLHVQTEDNGLQNPFVTTHLFSGGSIITSRKELYADLVKAPDAAQRVRRLMERQHKDVLRQLVGGAFDLLLGLGDAAAPGRMVAAPGTAESLADAALNAADGVPVDLDSLAAPAPASPRAAAAPRAPAGAPRSGAVPVRPRAGTGQLPATPRPRTGPWARPAVAAAPATGARPSPPTSRSGAGMGRGGSDGSGGYPFPDGDPWAISAPNGVSAHETAPHDVPTTPATARARSHAHAPAAVASRTAPQEQPPGAVATAPRPTPATGAPRSDHHRVAASAAPAAAAVPGGRPNATPNRTSATAPFGLPRVTEVDIHGVAVADAAVAAELNDPPRTVLEPKKGAVRHPDAPAATNRSLQEVILAYLQEAGGDLDDRPGAGSATPRVKRG